jgi:TRAP-type C4-dicarboxylate transport system permease small subunit
LHVKRLLERVGDAANMLTAAMFLTLILLLFSMVITRNFLKVGAVWVDDLVRYLQIWVVYTAAIHLTMRGDHIIMDAGYTRLPAIGRLWVRRFVALLSLACCAIVGYLALVEAVDMIRLGERSSSGTFPAALGYGSLPFGFLLMALASLYYLLFLSQSDTYGSAGVS